MRMIGCFAPDWGIRGCKKFKDIEREEKVISEGHIGWKKILSDIQDGTFAKDWISENQTGCMHFGAMRRREAEHQLEAVGAELRKLYSWNGTDKLINN